MRKSPALILSAGLLAMLSACAPTNSTLSSGDCTPELASGPSSKTVSATGAPGAATLSFASPLHSKNAERSVLTHGSGPAAERGSVVIGALAAASGTGQGDTKQQQLVVGLSADSQVPAAVVDGLICSRAGDRIALVIPGSQISADAAPADNSADVYVFDVQSVYPGRANGTEQAAEAGFPSVVRAPDGRPGLTVPSGEVPSELRSTTLIEGTGKTVSENDILLVQKTGVLWSDKSVFESTWADGGPVGLVVSDETPVAQGGVVPGLKDALVGQKVGSQVLVVVPPAEGFGATGNSNPPVPGDATLVYVVDILGIATA